ncbi:MULTISPECIES: AI-2E family transporter [unclassified Rhodococcus (in: high G+C Gram-positive bacteria)]|uniref:AI-2E family transporter n=1 Tax=unclassified Rhodococcus (in: high G+C Gram-positive bacteria) TaxID=192944 RepID=UPI001639E706|nr:MULTISPECIES: AI-2E family transporter [unclassified Rhodococcus (in: high G+C Gram-positive bacteria)]MBC2644575.1 AI-2E family transporter [Rhodococcus sp. 3A]MBC2897736.1 AI-2E family transporter [Rhodococcus sp. 4CII]
MPIAPGLGSAEDADRRPAPQPVHDNDPVPEAEAVAARISTPEEPLGHLGPRFNRRSPFFIGATGAAGVAVTYGAVHLLITAQPILVLIGLALFLALGLDPITSWLVDRYLPRWLAVTIVFTVALALVVAFFAVAIPPMVTQAEQLIDRAPDYLRQLQDHSSTVGRLNDRYHLQDRLTDAVNGSGQTLVNEAVSAGTAVVDAVGKSLILAVLTVYFLANLPQLRATGYRLIPHSRRPRAILIGDQITAKVGAYVLGNVLISVIAGIATSVWLIAFDVPYALFLGIFVALLDLVPVVGSTIAGVVVAAVALTVSLPVCIATIIFFVAFRLAEDYLLVPRIIGRTVHVPALTTVVAVLIGGALLGIVGALVAIPIAAAIHLLVEEITFPRLDRA